MTSFKIWLVTFNWILRTHVDLLWSIFRYCMTAVLQKFGITFHQVLKLVIRNFTLPICHVLNHHSRISFLDLIKHLQFHVVNPYCLMHQSVTFDFHFALGMKPSDITSSPCLTAHASTWLISNHISPWHTMSKWDSIELLILNKV